MKITKRKSLFSKITGFEKAWKSSDDVTAIKYTAELEEDDSVKSEQRVIIKTNTPDYVPEGLEVVARIDEFLFTASISELSLDQLKLLDSDPEIVSVMLAERLRIISENSSVIV